MVVGDADRFAITARERFRFSEGAPSIHRTNGVHHMFSWQAAAGGYDGFAGGQGTDFSYDALALLKNRWAASAVDGSVYASSADERRVGGVDDGLRRLVGDIGRAMKFERLAIGECHACCEVGHGGLIGSLQCGIQHPNEMPRYEANCETPFNQRFDASR
jgi:hypothetical protein